MFTFTHFHTHSQHVTISLLTRSDGVRRSGGTGSVCRSQNSHTVINTYISMAEKTKVV